MDIQGTKPVVVITPGLQATTESAGQAAASSITVSAVKPVAATSQAGTDAAKRSAPSSPAPLRLEAIAKQLQEFLQTSQRDLEFSVDADTKAQVVTVRDSAGDVIRQIPSEEALRIMKNLDATLGSLVDQQA